MDVSGSAKLNFKAVVYMQKINFYNKSMKKIRTQAYRKKSVRKWCNMTEGLDLYF